MKCAVFTQRNTKSSGRNAGGLPGTGCKFGIIPLFQCVSSFHPQSPAGQFPFDLLHLGAEMKVSKVTGRVGGWRSPRNR
jgi:hypothetical protein